MAGPDATRSSNRDHVLTHRVPFGETDAAGVVFYPNYLRWFDRATHELFRSVGLPLKDLEREERIVLPVVSVGAEFKRALNYDDEIEIRSHFAEVSERSVRVVHEIARGGDIVSTGWEVRGWATLKDGAFHVVPIPLEIRRRLS